MSKGRRRATGTARNQASRAARASTRRGPVSVSPWVSTLSKARAAARRAAWDDATRLYQQVVTQRPDQLEALEALGRVALERKQPGQAVVWLERARHGAPRSAHLLALLGRAQRQSGAIPAAIATFQKAIALDATRAVFWLELGLAQVDARELQAAVTSYLRAIELDRESALGWHLVSQALSLAGKPVEALEAARQALARNPWFGAAHLAEAALLERTGSASAALPSYCAAAALPDSRAVARAELERLAADLEQHAPDPMLTELGLAREMLAGTNAGAGLVLGRRLREQQRLASAVICFESALAGAPSIELYRELGTTLADLGQRDRARERLLQALDLEARDVASYRLLGALLASDLRFAEGEARWQRLLAECPDDVIALVNLGVAALRMGRPSEAIPLQERAVALCPDLIEPHINLAAALADNGAPLEASAAHQRALAIDPLRWAVHSNLLLNAHFDPSLRPEDLLAKHREFGRALCESVAPLQGTCGRDADPERRLRIGYVSPDFCDHPVAYFLEPVLREHDRQAFEVYCYADVARPDPITQQLRQQAQMYRDCTGDTDQALAERILADRIDILIDLAGHGLQNRLPVFARKPSPVQATWLGYFDTTGLERIDYRIADAHSVPSGAERLFVEQVVRLPRSSTCFLPRLSPAPVAPPCLRRGYLTFGCFSNPAKITRDAAAVFGRVLRAVGDSQLLFKYHAFADPGIRARFLRWFAEEGIARDRIRFQGHAPLEQYLAAFGEIDVALDPFPYSGETTALHTLWMGVPLVALEGRTVAERLASRVLRVAELDAWVAQSPDEYVRIAERLAADRKALGAQRQSLRQRLQESPLLDHRGFTRELETAYRGMWQRWCASAASRTEGESLLGGAAR